MVSMLPKHLQFKSNVFFSFCTFFCIFCLCNHWKCGSFGVGFMDYVHFQQLSFCRQKPCFLACGFVHYFQLLHTTHIFTKYITFIFYLFIFTIFYLFFSLFEFQNSPIYLKLFIRFSSHTSSHACITMFSCLHNTIIHNTMLHL